jgi:formate dehydrogenase subunit gamma
MTDVPRVIQRYALGERLVHAVAGLSYVYLLLTGLAFWTPALYWVAVALGGGYVSRALHPWVGLLFAAAVAWMLVAWRRHMRITAEDRAWRRAILHYVRHDDSRVPGAGRFNYGQKMLFWIMAASAAALLVSGTVMWFVAVVPSNLVALRSWMTLAHSIAALVTIGAFIVHVYMGVAVVPGGLHAVVHGDVTEEWARHHHPLWVDTPTTPPTAPADRTGTLSGGNRVEPAG